MNHEIYERMASRHLDNELDAAHSALFLEHLSGCPDCRATVDSWSRLRADIKPLDEPGPSRDTERALLDRAYRAAREHSTAPWSFFGSMLHSLFRPALGYAAAAMLLGAILGGVGHRFTSPQPVETTEQAEGVDAGQFNTVYPGSIAEALTEIEQEGL